MRDTTIIEQLAAGRPIVDLAHPRQRTDGVVGALWHDGSATAICAHACQLSTLPDQLAALHHLARLDLGGNQLTSLPALPPQLRELYVDDNHLTHLPALPRLSVLDANRNRLVQLPPLRDLDFAYLAGNQLTSIPPTTGVRYLNVSNNPLHDLAVTDPAIRELRAENAQLHSLSLERLTSLSELALRNNHLTSLPDAISALTALRILDLRNNQLDDLPETLRLLPLDKLDLRWNPLRRHPSWLDELSRRGCRVYT